MSPEAIPWLLCGAFCIVPIVLGVGSYYLMVHITNQFPTKDVTEYIDQDGRKHTITETTRLTREDRKLRNQEEEKE